MLEADFCRPIEKDSGRYFQEAVSKRPIMEQLNLREGLEVVHAVDVAADVIEVYVENTCEC